MKNQKDKYPIHRLSRRSTEEVEAWEDSYDEAKQEFKKVIKKEIKKYKCGKHKRLLKVLKDL